MPNSFGRLGAFPGVIAAACCAPVLGQDCGAWTRFDPPGPSLRSIAAMVFEAGGVGVTMYGGKPANMFSSPETWSWDGTVWTRRTDGPYRVLHGMSYDTARQRMVVFGGSESGTPNQETREFDGTQWFYIVPEGFSPSMRAGHSMVYDSVRNRTVLFGGGDGFGLLDYGDTWEWDGVRWMLMATTGPASRSRFAMAFDAVRGRTVLFGGVQGQINGPGFFGDTWEWDGQSWTLVAIAGPSPRRGHTMVARPDGVVMFGGRSSAASFPKETWKWDGTVWTLLAADGPPGRISGAMAFDAARSRAVLFGGGDESSTLLEGVWEFTGSNGPPTLASQPVSRVMQSGEAVQFSVTTVAPPLSYQWRRNGVALTKGGGVSGVTSPVLTINPVTPELAGDYTVQVVSACGATVSATAALAVVACYANCDGSSGTPALTANDLSCFIDQFAAASAYANCDGTTQAPVLTGNDFMCFLNRFVAGCP